MKDCIFCKIANGEIPSQKIYENDSFFSIPDVKPKTEGHSLIISKKHFESLLDLPSTLGTELLDCIKKTSLKLIDRYKSEGFNVVLNNGKSADIGEDGTRSDKKSSNPFKRWFGGDWSHRS